MKLSNLISNLYSRLQLGSSLPTQRIVYTHIVTKTRQPWLYIKAGVPDTVTGRFDMITLHSFLILERLSDKGDAEAEFSQKFFDEVFLDMDHSLREMGVGDLSVGKKIRKMSEIFYGACNGYRKALSGEGREQQEKALGEAFKRNITGQDVDQKQLDNLVGYTFKSIAQIDKIALADILAGEFDWPELELDLELEA